MKILLTGASGVIGKSLIKTLARYGSYIEATFNKNKISNPTNKKIKFIHYQDVLEGNNYKKYDQIWHFATYGQPAKFMSNWNEIVNLNVKDLTTLMRFLKDDGQFFYASTSELYGDQKSDEWTIPSSDPLSKRAIYTESKRLGEAILNTEIGSRATFFRICLAYSQNFLVGDNRVIYELVVKGLKNNYIQLLDDGSSKRQYIFIEDAVSMMEDIAFNKQNNNTSGIWNISNPKSITILELAELIGYFLKKPIKTGPKNENPLHALSKIEIIPKRYIQTFESYPYTDIADGLTKVIDSAKKQLKDL